MTYDLFGEIPVTHDDIHDWVAAVAPRWLSSERSFRNYVRDYNVVEKIRAAKLAGTFEDTVSRPAQPWHSRLALDVIV